MSSTVASSRSALPGIACVTGGIFSLTLSDSLAKWLGEFYAPIQLLFVRGLVAACVIGVILLVFAGRRGLRTQHLGVHAMRGAVNVASAACFYLSLTLLPLAQTTAIAFSAPLIVTALSVAFLGERVDAKAWAAVCLGFVGVLLAARPMGGIQWAVVLPLLTAMGYAVMMVSAKRIGAQESMLTTMFYIALGQAVVSVALQPWFWRPLQMEHAWGLAGIALFSTLGLGLITQGFRLAPASVVAPFDYTGLIWATGIGWLVWQEIPDGWTVVGAALIAISGVAVARRPRALAPSE